MNTMESTPTLLRLDADPNNTGDTKDIVGPHPKKWYSLNAFGTTPMINMYNSTSMHNRGTTIAPEIRGLTLGAY